MSAMSADENRSVRQELEAVRDELRGIADEVRLKLHLAEMDAKDAWSELQPKLKDYEQRIAEASNDVAAELRAFGGELRVQLQKLRKRLD